MTEGFWKSIGSERIVQGFFWGGGSLHKNVDHLPTVNQDFEDFGKCSELCSGFLKAFIGRDL